LPPISNIFFKRVGKMLPMSNVFFISGKVWKGLAQKVAAPKSPVLIISELVRHLNRNISA